MCQERLIHRTEKQMVYLLSICKSPKVIFDLGANVGLYSCLLSELYPDAVIYAFEPLLSNFENLKKNIELNNLSNVKPFDFGMADKEQDAIMCIPIDREVENTGLYSIKIANGKNPTKAHFKNMEAWCKENNIYPDLIKMDVEGCELDIILSSINVIKDVQVMFMEEKFGNSPKLRSVLSKYFDISKSVLELTCINKRKALNAK